MSQLESICVLLMNLVTAMENRLLLLSTWEIPGFRSGTPQFTDAKPREIKPRFIWQLHRFTVHLAAASKNKNSNGGLKSRSKIQSLVYAHSLLYCFCRYLPVYQQSAEIRRYAIIYRLLEKKRF